MSESTDLLEALEAEIRDGRPFVLATVVATAGSTYRRPGARLLIRSDGSTVGRLSAGCVEAELVDSAAEVVSADAPRLLTIDHRHPDEAHLGWGLGCAGKMEVLLEPARTAAVVAEALRASRFAPILLSTDPAGGQHVVGERREGWFVEELEPPLRLLVCGDGPEAAEVETIGRSLGWDAAPVRSPGELPVVTARTHAVICSHRFETDAAFLASLAASPAAYVGLVGPRARAERLAEEAGADPERLHAPAGLDLGAETPEEIAVAIVAEILAVRALRPGGFLRDRRGPIH